MDKMALTITVIKRGSKKEGADKEFCRILQIFRMFTYVGDLQNIAKNIAKQNLHLKKIQEGQGRQKKKLIWPTRP
jgi:hypothetical protein